MKTLIGSVVVIAAVLGVSLAFTDAQDRTRSVLGRPLRPATSISDLIPVKDEYRQLRISSLPEMRGKIDGRAIAIESAYAVNPSKSRLTTAQKNELSVIANLVEKNSLTAANSRWKSFLVGLKNGGVPLDINALIQAVIRDAYLENNKDLLFHASKVRYFNEQKKACRDYIEELRRQSRNLVSRRDVRLKASIDKAIKDWTDTLNSLGDDAQLANVDLQNWLQKMQQLIQMMSNVSKTLHDTAMAVIRKIG